MHLPGVQLDAVNPDYFAVRILNPNAANIPSWILPGNLLFGQFPVLTAFYHGTLPLYLGLPGYALFGTGVVGIRLTHMCFGLLVLASCWLFMRSFGVGRSITALSLSGLALDPGFAFSFRSMYYIVLIPAIPLLLAAALIQRRQAVTIAYASTTNREQATCRQRSRPEK